MSEVEHEDNVQQKRMIFTVRRRVQAARDQYNRAVMTQSLSSTVILDLASAALQYHEVLYEFRDEDVLDPPWEERDLDWITDYIGETVDVERPAPGMSRNTVTEERPAITHAVNPDRIKQLTQKLDDVCHELGLSAKTREGVNRVEIDDELLEEVEGWRQNKKAE